MSIIMEELFDLEEELVLFFANHIDSFHNIGLIYHHTFFEKLSKTGFDVSGHDSLDIWEAVKSLKQKGYLLYTSMTTPFEAYSFRINKEKCVAYFNWYQRNHSVYGKLINHISKHSWFYGSLFGALVGSIFTVLIEKLLLKIF